MASSGTLTSNKYNSAYWSFEWTSSVTSAGKTKVSWNLYAKGRSSSPTKYTTKIRLYINGSIVYELWDEAATFTGTKYKSGSFTVTHNNAGVGTFTARVYVTKIYDAIDTKSTSTITLDDNKPNTVTFTYPTVFTDEEVPFNITYSNQTGSDLQSLKVRLTAADKTAITSYYTMASNSSGNITSGTYSFNFSSELNKLYAAASATNALKVYLTLQENYDGYSYAENKVVTVNIVNANPTQSPTIVDSNSTVTTLTGNSSKFVLGYSTATATFNSSAKKSATISSQTITNEIGTVLRNGDGAISPIKDSTIVFKTVDSRGNSVSTTKNLTIVDYFKPICQIKGIAQSSSTALNILLTGSAFVDSFGAKNNSITIQYRYKNDSTNGSYGSWTNADVSITNSTFTQNFNVTVPNSHQNYTFQVRITDSLETMTSEEFVYTTGLEPVLKVKNNGNNVYTLGVIKGQTTGKDVYTLAKASGYTGTADQLANQLLNPVAFPVGAIYTTFGTEKPGELFGGSWEALGGRFIYGAGTVALNGTGGGTVCTLTTSTMPKHKHQSPYQTYATSASNYLIRYRDRTVYDSYQYTQYTGGGESHENMPPYIAAHVYQRIG